MPLTASLSRLHPLTAMSVSLSALDSHVAACAGVPDAKGLWRRRACCWGCQHLSNTPQHQGCQCPQADGWHEVIARQSSSLSLASTPFEACCYAISISAPPS